jgi:hypothetical protein
VALGCKGGDSADERRQRCRDVRDKLVDVELDRRLSDGPAAHAVGREARVERHRQNLRASLGESFVDRCARDESPEYLACVLEAVDAEAAGRCRKKGGA